MIILTRAEADAVRGNSAPGHALDPVRISWRTHILPEAALADPHHAAKAARLAVLPRRGLQNPTLPMRAYGLWRRLTSA